LRCNGVDKCEFTDDAIFKDCKRFEADKEAMQELFHEQGEQKRREATSTAGILVRFYQRIQASKCRVPCDGVPVIKPLAKPPSNFGKMSFVGCSKWRREPEDNRFDHRMLPIPANVDEHDLIAMMQSGGNLPVGAAEVNETCSVTVHPRRGWQTCRE